MRDRDLYAQILGITDPWHVTDVHLDVPRVECPEHGVVQVSTPWSEPGSRFTEMA